MRPTRTTIREFVELRTAEGGPAHFPALDGLRGLAVIAVVAYHLDLSLLVGGFLGVSSFFTLSGFLITTLLLRQLRRDGSIGLRSFWSRRLRRLLPASLATLALVGTLFSAFVATEAQRASMTRDLLASLLDVLNWTLIADGTSYGASFSAPSPVLHFWSLAVEEQLYVVLPLLLIGLWRVLGGRRRRLAGALALLAAASAVLPVVFSMSDDRVYFGTDTRAAELLVGAVLAVVLSRQRTRRALAVDHRLRDGVVAAGAAVLALQVAAWWMLPQDTWWLYRGGLAVYALLTCVVVAAAVVPAGPVHTVLGGRALRWFGRRSYAIYLVHWPIILSVRQLAPGLGTAATATIAVAVSLCLAELSTRFVETPIRTGQWPPPRRAARVAVASVGVVALIALAPVGGDGRDSIDFQAAVESFEQMPDTPTPTPAPDTPADDGPPHPRVFTVGDSTSLLSAMGLAVWGEETGRLLNVGADAEFGCAVSRFAVSRFDTDIAPEPGCTDWPDTWPAAIESQQPTLVQVVTGIWEVADVRIPGATGFSAIGDPVVDEFIAREMLTAVDLLSADGALVLLVLWPAIGDWAPARTDPALERQADPARMDRLHDIQRWVAAQRPGSVRVLDLDEWLGERADDPALRPDGTHIDSETMLSLYRDGLGEETLRIYREWWSDR